MLTTINENAYLRKRDVHVTYIVKVNIHKLCVGLYKMPYNIKVRVTTNALTPNS